jgi:methylaspartate mutase epsilon subunit
MLDGIRDEHFPVQVRHGSAQPYRIIQALIDLGLDTTEGGPVSYCLPYGRTPLADSVRNWRAACELLADGVDRPHLETFGGCMLGQLCPPSELVAISVLEAMFFQQNGVAEVSVSYAQQTHFGQDLEALSAVRRLCAELLSGDGWHLVVYAYMGRYPRTPDGAMAVLARSAELSVLGGAQRLIVKTAAESMRIPTVAENISALEYADAAARLAGGVEAPEHDPDGGQVYREARVLIDAVLEQAPDLGDAFLRAFAHGLLDVPFCLHPDNAGRARARIGPDGRLGWAEIGALPLGGLVERSAGRPLTSADFLASLSYVQQTYDAAALAAGPTPLADHHSGAQQR